MKKIHSIAILLSALLLCSCENNSTSLVHSKLDPIVSSTVESSNVSTDDTSDDENTSSSNSTSSTTQESTAPDESSTTIESTTEIQTSEETPASSTASETNKPAETETTEKPVQPTEAPVVQSPIDGACVIKLGGDMEINSDGAESRGNDLLITKEGNYWISGEIANGKIEVNTTKKVKLYFAGVKVTNSNGPAILVSNAKRITVNLVESSKNYFTDGGQDKKNNGAIFTHDTIDIEGSGEMHIKANNREGIASNDDIVVNGGKIFIESFDDGLNANDDITINDGYVFINANGDGIDSKGTTNINGGTTIVSATGEIESAIESDGILNISGGNFIGVGGTDGLKSPSNASGQNTVMFNFASCQEAEKMFALQENSSIIALFKPMGKYNTITISTPDISLDTEYTVLSGGSSSSINSDGWAFSGDISGSNALGTFTLSSKISIYDVG